VGTSGFFPVGNVFAYDAAGITNCSGSPKVCQPLWRAPMSSFVDNAAMISNGVVYYGDGKGELAAFNEQGCGGTSGTTPVCDPIWTGHTPVQTAADGSPIYHAIHGSPTYYKGRVLVGADDGNVYAFDAKGDGCQTPTTGTTKVCQPLWVAQTGAPSGISATPAVATNGALFVATLANAAFAFDANGVTNCSGTPLVCSPLWTAPAAAGAPEGSYASPAVFKDHVFFTKPHQVFAYDANGVQGCTTTPPSTTKTCSALWHTDYVTYPVPIPFPPVYYSSPTITNNVLYIGAPDGSVYAYDATGTQNCSTTTNSCSPLKYWTIGTIDPSAPPQTPPLASPVWSSPTIANGRLYIGSSDFNLWCFGL
jgi:outer membrane protein assembly factor BamB